MLNDEGLDIRFVLELASGIIFIGLNFKADYRFRR